MKTQQQVSQRATLPLSALCLSPENMRKAKTSKQSDNQLKASIKSIGILQNLVVSEVSKNSYQVEAGGRRYLQCLNLVAEGHLSKSNEVPVLILASGQSTKEISLAENYLREKTHPVDEFEAFLYLYENDDFSVKDIALHFGETQKYVQQRLLLGGIAPELRELCRNNQLDMDILEAFTVSDNHEKQIEAYNVFKDDSFRFNSANIRSHLICQALTTKDKQVKFVGLSAYKKAGGYTMSDLFEDVIYISDREILETLLNNKMGKVIAKLNKKWAWVEIDYQLQNWQVGQYRVIAKELVKVPKKLVSEIDVKKARSLELEAMPADDHWTEALAKEWRELEEEIDLLEAELERHKVFVDDEIPFGGCLVTLDDKGTLLIHEGLVKGEDVSRLDEFRNPEKNNVDIEPSIGNEIPLYTQALQQDLSIYRQSIAKIGVASNINLGSDIAMFSLCYSVFGNAWDDYPLSIQVKNTAKETSKDDIAESKAQKELDTILLELDRTWIVDNKLDSLKAFRALPNKTKKALCAYCASYSLCGLSLGEQDSELAGYIFEQSEIEVSDYFRPTAHNFFKRIKEPHFTLLGNELLGDEWMSKNKQKKCTFIAEQMEKTVSGEVLSGAPLLQSDALKWMPKGF